MEAVSLVGAVPSLRVADTTVVASVVAAAVAVAASLAVAVLWVCFGIDYGTTRSVYFTVAMLHVLAEIPFLLRMV